MAFNNIDELRTKQVSVPAGGVSSTGAAPVQTSTSQEPLLKMNNSSQQGADLNEGDGSVTQQASLGEEYARLKEKELAGTLTPEEKIELAKLEEYNKKSQDEYESEAKQVSNVPPEKAKKYQEYGKLMVKGGTEYEKTSRVMDKFLSETDTKYQSLKTENEKRRYRDGLITDLQKVVNPNIKNSNLTKGQRKQGLIKIAIIYIMAAADKTSVNTILSLGQDKLDERIDNAKKTMSEAIFKQANLRDKTLSAEQKIDNLAEMMLSSDDDYAKITDPKLKKQYKDKWIAETVSDQLHMNITAEDMNTPQMKIFKEAYIEILTSLQDKGTDKSFSQLPPKDQAEIIHGVIAKNKDKIKSYSPDMQTELEVLDARCNIIMEMNKQRVSERDIYEALKNKKDLSIAEKELLAYYKDVQSYSGGNALLNQPARMTSDIGLSILTGKPAKNIQDKQYEYATKNFSAEDFVNGHKDSKMNEFIHDNIYGVQSKNKKYLSGAEKINNMIDFIMSKTNMSRDEVIKQLEVCGYISETDCEALVANSFAQKDGKVGAIAASIVRNHPNSNRKNLENDLTTFASGLSKAEATSYSTNQYTIDDAKKDPTTLLPFQTGLNANTGLSNSDRWEITESVASSTPREYASLFTKSLIQTGNADQQLEYSNFAKNTNNAAIAEGVAAAEQYVDESVKAKYSQNVDAMMKNFEGTPEYNNIQTARETGKTSYETQNGVSTNDRVDYSAKSEKSSKSNGNSVNSSASSSSSTATSSSSQTAAKARNVAASASTVTLSSEGQKSVQQLQTLVAQLSAQQSKQSKEQVLAQLERIITKIQDDAKAQNTKKLEQAKKAEAAELAQKEEELKKADEKGQILQEKVDAALSEENPQALEAATNELLEDFEQEVQKQSVSGIPQEIITQFKEASGDIAKIYDIVQKNLSGDMQNQFMAHLAKAKPYLVKDFITAYKNDPAVLKQLIELNPSLMSMLEPDTLISCGFNAKDIIEHGDKNSLSRMFYDLAREGSSAKSTLNVFYEAMGIKPDNDLSASEVVKKNDLSNVPGSDEWFAANFGGSGSSVVSNYKFDGGTAQDLTRKYFRWT